MFPIPILSFPPFNVIFLYERQEIERNILKKML